MESQRSPAADLPEPDFWPRAVSGFVCDSLSGNVSSLDTATLVAGYLLSSAGQFVSKVMEVDLVWSVVCTTNCLASGLTS